MKQTYENEFYFTVYPHAFTRIIKRILPANTQLIYGCYLEQMFGFHKPEGYNIYLTYAKLKEYTGIAHNKTISDALLILEALNLLTPGDRRTCNTRGYALNFDILRKINDRLVNATPDIAYEEYLHDVQDTIAAFLGTLPRPYSKNEQAVVQKMNKLSIKSELLINQLRWSKPSHNARLQTLRKSLKDILKSYMFKNISLEDEKYSFLDDLEEERITELESLCNIARGESQLAPDAINAIRSILEGKEG